MLIRTSEPDGLAVPLADVKRALRVDHSDDDALLTALIRSETRRYEDFSGRVMVPTVVEVFAERFGVGIVLPVHPVREVLSVTYRDESHAPQAVAASDWYLVDGPCDSWAIRWTDEFDAPVLSDRPWSVWVSLSAGYADPEEPESGVEERDAEPVDQRNITLLVGWQYDRGETMPFDEMRKTMGARRILR